MNSALYPIVFFSFPSEMTKMPLRELTHVVYFFTWVRG